MRGDAEHSTSTVRHLLGLQGVPAREINALLDAAEKYLPHAQGKAANLNTLQNRTIANLFFEDSTRTRCSFTIAAQRLGAHTIDLTSSGSSVKKGETIVDTALNIQAMGVHGIVVRCSASGGPKMIADAVRVPVINAGDGSHEHPTQGLLDMLTMRQRFGSIEGKTIAIVGDLSHSRVARSNIHGLTTMGAHVIAIGPATLAPKTFEKIADAKSPGKVKVMHDLDEALANHSPDVVMMLRVQFERAGDGPPLITGDYRQLYGMTCERAARLPAHTIIMHPGPMNRGLEIDSEVADDSKRSVILQQVTNGVAIRMAALAAVVK